MHDGWRQERPLRRHRSLEIKITRSRAGQPPGSNPGRRRRCQLLPYASITVDCRLCRRRILSRIYHFQSHIDAHPYQNQPEITETRQLTQFPRRQDKISGGEIPAGREGAHPDACRWIGTHKQRVPKSRSRRSGHSPDGENSHEQPEPAEARQVSSEAQRASVA